MFKSQPLLPLKGTIFGTRSSAYVVSQGSRDAIVLDVQGPLKGPFSNDFSPSPRGEKQSDTEGGGGKTEADAGGLRLRAAGNHRKLSEAGWALPQPPEGTTIVAPDCWAPEL